MTGQLQGSIEGIPFVKRCLNGKQFKDMFETIKQGSMKVRYNEATGIIAERLWKDHLTAAFSLSGNAVFGLRCCYI